MKHERRVGRCVFSKMINGPRKNGSEYTLMEHQIGVKSTKSTGRHTKPREQLSSVVETLLVARAVTSYHSNIAQLSAALLTGVMPLLSTRRGSLRAFFTARQDSAPPPAPLFRLQGNGARRAGRRLPPQKVGARGPGSRTLD